MLRQEKKQKLLRQDKNKQFDTSREKQTICYVKRKNKEKQRKTKKNTENKEKQRKTKKSKEKQRKTKKTTEKHRKTQKNKGEPLVFNAFCVFRIFLNFQSSPEANPR